MRIGGKLLDLKKVTIPVYNLATREDHIAPAPFNRRRRLIAELDPDMLLPSKKSYKYTKRPN